MSKKLTKQERVDKEYQDLQKYNNDDLIRYEKLIGFIDRYIINEKLWWVLSWLPFMLIWGLCVKFELFRFDLSTLLTLVISHSIYWFFAGKKSTQELVNQIQEENDISLDVLLKIKEERSMK